MIKLILTHSNSDFDAVASQLAAARLYPGALPVLSPALNPNVREFLALYGEHMPFVAAGDLPDAPIARLILVDTAEPPRLKALEAAPSPIPTTIVEHHPPDREPLPHEEWHYAETGATATILAQQLIERGETLEPAEATLLLLGIYEDTGSLSFPTTRQADVACAAWLLGQGARIDAVGEFLSRPLTAAQERLYRRIEAAMRLEPIAGQQVLLAAVDAGDGPVPQLSPLAHELRDRYAPAVTALAIGTSDAGTQVILRSDGEVFDSGALASALGGGGHPAAGAAFVRGRLAADVLAEVEAAIRAGIRPAPTAGAIMTTPVRAVPLDATVGEAAGLLARYGHTALPVIDGERVVHGLVARRELDRALRHGLSNAPLARYMWRGVARVPPAATLDELRQALVAGEGERMGRALVVDEQQRLLGIVTRSDLLRAANGQIEREGDGARADDLLARFLDPALLEILRRAAALAEERGWAVYVVGGPVRDMLLGRAPGDVDLVVEGEAIALAEALAAELGGRVRSHAQFGTATLELEAPARGRGDGEPDSGDRPPPRSLDFVTARTEFYERPAALPDVEAASLRHDLHRRDFTINTLAICLNPARYGRLYDFYGGRRDLERGLIRVLHNLSFIDDPTRILRAARLAARLGFTIEPRTRALIADAIEHDALGRTTPQRIIAELLLVFAEAHPEGALALLHELDVLRALHPALGWSAELARQFAAAREAAFPDAALAEVHAALFVYPLDDAAREELIARYRLSAAHARLLRDVSAARRAAEELRAPDVPNSRIDQALREIGAAALRAAQIAEPEPASGAIARFADTLRDTRLDVDGRFVQSLGVAPGPQIGRLLAELRAVRLDGGATTRAEQEAWLRERIGRKSV